MIYLDNAATTPLLPEVLAEMIPFLSGEYGNPGSLHSVGRRAASAVLRARERVAAAIGAKPEQIVFTSGGTEANNLAIRGTRPRMIAIGATEHDSAFLSAGFVPKYKVIPVDTLSGETKPPDALPEGVDIVSVMYINNETGVRNSIREFARMAHEAGALFHTDCVQALGSVELDVDEIGCDLMSLSAHKIGGPKGVGALYVRSPAMIADPLIIGGSAQERGIRGGTENVAGIVGFGKACEIATASIRETGRHMGDLRDALFETLVGNDTAAGLNGHTSYTSKIVNLCFDGVDAESLVLMLDAMGVAISAGSACRSHSSEPSRVLTAMGLSPEQARSSIRVSFSPENTVDEVAKAADAIVSCVKVLRGEGGAATSNTNP